MEFSTQDLVILLLLFMKGTLLPAWTLKVNIAIYKEKKNQCYVSACVYYSWA